MTHDHTPEDHEPDHAESPTAHLLAELQLFGHRPFEGEPDPRPLPEDHLVRAAVADTFDAFTAALQDTRLEPDLEDLLWGIVNVLHCTPCAGAATTPPPAPPPAPRARSTTMNRRSSAASESRTGPR